MNSQTSPHSIFIIDDSPNNLRLLSQVLFEAGYQVRASTSGRSALRSIFSTPPDLVLLDVMMPDMDGYEVCRRLQTNAKTQAIPVIFVSALESVQDKVAALQAGGVDYITKPFQAEEIIARVKTHLAIRQLRTALQVEHSRMQTILDTIEDAIVLTDADGLVQYMNPAAVALTGMTVSEALAQPWQTWWQMHHVPEIQARIEQAMQEGHAWRREIVQRRSDGSLYDAAVTITPLRDVREPERIEGYVFVQRDITAFKEAQRIKDEFVSNVSHELRTPLSVITLISGNLDTLYDRLSDERRHKMICDIREQTRMLTHLVEDILQISRIDGQRVSQERQSTNLAELAHEEVARQLPLAHDKESELAIEAPQPVMIPGNSEQLRKIVRNLLNNAIKYTSPGGHIVCRCLPVERIADPDRWPGCATLPKGLWAALCVQDDGMGIPQSDLPRIFERFYRVENQNDIPGAGLGLAITRELVLLHNGVIAVDSELGTGSTFAVYLPLLEAGC